MEESKTEDAVHFAKEEYVSEDPVILDAFNDLKTAILAKRTDIVRKILSAAQSMRDDDDVDIDGEDEQQIKREIINKYDSEEFVDLLSLLLKHQDTDSGTLLHYATRVGSVDIVRTLLSAGVNCTIKNNVGKTAYEYCEDERMKQVFVEHLMQSVSQSRLFLVKQVLSMGIDVNSNDGAITKNSVLHWASSFADIPTLKCILESGADVNITNACGATPLHDAVKRKDIHIIKELLLYGADRHVKANSGLFAGKSAKDLAIESSIPEIVNLFHDENDESETCTQIQSEEKYFSKTVPEICLTHAKAKFPKTIKTHELCKYYCPKPKVIKQFDGILFVPPTDMDVFISTSKYSVGINGIVEDFIPKFLNMGINLKLVSAQQFVTTKCYVQCSISNNIFIGETEYKMQFTTNKIFIIGSSLRSLFYAFSTFLQTIKLFKGKAIPLLQIHDWSTCPYRAMLFDFTYNDFPSFKLWQIIIDNLALFKVSQIQLCTSIFSNSSFHCCLKESFHKLQIYSKQKFLDIVPYIKLSDHPRLLSNKNNNGLFSLDLKAFDSLISLFLCQSIIHVDLTNIQNVQCISSELQEYCQLKNCYLQLYNNIDMDLMLECLPSYLDNCAAIVKLSSVEDINDTLLSKVNIGMDIIVRYDNQVLNRLFPDVISYTNDLFQILNNECWGNDRKYGFCSSFTPSNHALYNITVALPCLIFANAMVWNNVKLDDDYMENVLNYLYYEDDSDIMGKSLMEVSTSLPITNHISVLNHVIETESLKDLYVTSQSLQDICKAVKLNRSMLSKTLLKSTFKDEAMSEFQLLSNIVFFLARLCYLMLSLNQSKRCLSNLHNLQRSDNANRLMSMIKEMEENYKHLYISKDGNALTPVKILDKFLEELLPPQTPTTPTSPLFSVFTI